MQATASTVLFPGLGLNTGPKKYEEPLQGFASWIFNDFFKYGKLNVTIMTTEVVGIGCNLIKEAIDGQTNETVECEGIYDQLQSCQSDFSLFALGIRSIDSRIENQPILTGPQTESAQMLVLSYNITGELNISDLGFTKIDLAIYLTIISLLLSIALVNVLALQVKQLIFLKIRRSMTWRPLTLLVPRKGKWPLLMKIFGKFNLRKTREAYFLLMTMSVLGSAVIIGNISSNSILNMPPKHFKSIFEAVSNKTYKIILVKGLSASLEHFKDPQIRDIKKSPRVIWFEPLDLTILAENLASNPADRFLIGNSAIIRVAKAYICEAWFANQSKFLFPWLLTMLLYHEGPSVATYSSCIRPELRRRLDKMFNRWMQSYLWTHYMEGAAFRVPVANENKNFLCIKNAPPYEPKYSYSKKMENNEQPYSFAMILAILGAGVATSMFLYTLEQMVHCFNLYLRHKRRKRIRKFLKHTTNVHRAWKLPVKS